jgi:hypothetical protein
MAGGGLVAMASKPHTVKVQRRITLTYEVPFSAYDLATPEEVFEDELNQDLGVILENITDTNTKVETFVMIQDGDGKVLLSRSQGKPGV